MKRSRIFISYSHKDIDFLNRLVVHLKALEREGLVDVWSDLKIKTGDDWRKEIEDALMSASVAILLVSADFLASDFIANDELPKLLDAAQTRGTRIIPVILKTCGFSRTLKLSKFQALNDPAKPLIDMSHGKREAVWDKVAQVVAETVETVREPKAEPPLKLPTTMSYLAQFNRKPKYKAGQRVLHGTFGKGIVLESNLKNGDEEVIVEFAHPKFGKKRLAASFAQLVIVEDDN